MVRRGVRTGLLSAGIPAIVAIVALGAASPCRAGRDVPFNARTAPALARVPPATSIPVPFLIENPAPRRQAAYVILSTAGVEQSRQIAASRALGTTNPVAFLDPAVFQIPARSPRSTRARVGAVVEQLDSIQTAELNLRIAPMLPPAGASAAYRAYHRVDAPPAASAHLGSCRWSAAPGAVSAHLEISVEASAAYWELLITPVPLTADIHLLTPQSWIVTPNPDPGQPPAVAPANAGAGALSASAANPGTGARSAIGVRAAVDAPYAAVQAILWLSRDGRWSAYCPWTSPLDRARQIPDMPEIAVNAASPAPGRRFWVAPATLQLPGAPPP